MEEGDSPMVLDDKVPPPGEASAAKRGHERPGAGGVMELVVERANLLSVARVMGP